MKDFSSLEDLIFFLRNDDSDKLVWSPSFTCKDFSETLIEKAKEKGYRMSIYVLDGSELTRYEESWVAYASTKGYIAWWGQGDAHSVCVTFIVELDTDVLIEPQNDAILTKQYEVLYGGEIEG